MISEARDLVVTRSIPAAYEADGAVVKDSLQAFGEGAFTVTSVPRRLTDEDVVEVHEEEVLWGGGLGSHYGHFLTESVSRLWPLLTDKRLRAAPVVFTGSQASHFARDWLQGFGVRTVQLPERGVVRFNKMFVPEPAWRHDAWICPEIRDIHLRARQGLAVAPFPRNEVVWLSRSQLARDRIPYDERLLEWLLAERVTIVNPETMPLVEQIALLEGSRAVAGIAGSAFHTLLMAVELPDCLYLCPPWDRAAFPAQHRFLDTNATFEPVLAVAARTRRAREQGLGFPAGYRVSIPKALRALGATVLPTLLEDPRLAAFAAPERHWTKADDPHPEVDLDTVVAQVLLDPLSVKARVALGARFEAQGLDRCALEQFVAIADLGGEHADARLQAARLQ